MSMLPQSPAVDPAHGASGVLEHAQGLAALAFSSFSHLSSAAGNRHLALLPAETLELDLTDPGQRRFGDYELLEHLGEGGMGMVYRARQDSLDRDVAVKLLSAGPWASREFIARFEREAQNAARMQHPNIVTVYEVGSVEGLHFFSMRLVRGESLSAKLRRGERLSPKAAASLLRTIAEAVDYAHNLGVLHLDLKPGNVLLDETGTPYVTDFGLARRLENALAIENDEISGTPAYMAPEQAQVRANKLTRATDIWGLGAILYELLTGEPPFRGQTAQDTVRLVLEGRVRAPRRTQPALSRDLEAIVMRCLSRDPAGRYPSARVLADDLQQYIAGRPVNARPLNAMQRAARWAKREPKLAVTIACAVAVLIAGLVTTSWQWQRARSNAAVAMQRLWDSRSAGALTAMDAGDGWKAAPLLLANLSEMETRGDVARAQNARKRLGIIENANPKLIDVLPTPPETNVLAFSPDAGRLAASPGTFDLRLFDVPDGRQLWALDGKGNPNGSGWSSPDHMEFDPGGNMLLISEPIPSRTGTFPFGIFMSRVDARNGRWLALPPIAIDRSEWGYSADGRHMITFDHSAGAQTWFGEPWRAWSSQHKMPDTEFAGPVLFTPDLRSFAFHAPGYHGMGVYATDTLKQLWRLDSTVVDRQTAWMFSPDSRWLGLGNVKGEVLVVDTRTQRVRRLSPQPLNQIRELRFSDDGRWLAAATGKGGIYLWSWPEGRLLVWPFGMDAQPERVRLDRAHSRVLASGTSGSARLWDIPETRFDMDRGDAVQLGDRLATVATPEASDRSEGGGDAVAWSPARGLLAHVAMQRVQLERLPAPALKRAQAAPIKTSALHFDGTHLVSVEGARVRVLDALSEKPLSAPFEFPQPPGFAELTNDGLTLVVTAGRMLYAYEVVSGKLRFAPVALTDSPQHVELNPDNGSVAIGRLDHDALGVAEIVELRSLRSGARIAPSLRFQNAADGLLFNATGTRLLVWNFAHLSLRDGHTFAPIPGPLADLQTAPHEVMEEGRINQAVFGAEGDLWLSAYRAAKDDQPIAELRHYSRAGGLQAVRTTRMFESIVSRADGSLVVVPQGVGLGVWQRGNGLLELPDVARDTIRSEAAASADGRWMARAQRNGVVLFDAHDNTRIATLSVPLPAPDLVFELAFSPDGDRLLARSLRGRQMVWNLTPDTRATAKIARELALREIAGDGMNPQADPTPAERADLRAGDPGTPLASPNAEAPVARTLPGGAIPLRDPHAKAELLDLTSCYTFGFAEVANAATDSPGDYGWLAPGVQRLLGIDYDLRGGIQLEAASGVTDVARGNHPSSITVSSPRADVAGLDLLFLKSTTGTQRDDRVTSVTLQFADGSSVVQWIRTGGQVGEYFQVSQLGRNLRMAAFGYDARGYAGIRRPTHIYAVRLANPYPRRSLRSITFTAMPGTAAATVILAVTVEPGAPANTKH